MKKITLITTFICYTFLCAAQEARSPRFRMQSFKRFVELDSSHIILIPIKWDNNAKAKNFKIAGNGSIKNILFYDPTNEYQKFLFDEDKQIIKTYSGHLLKFRRPTDTTKRPQNKDYFYYSVIQDDYNEDGKLDSDDPRYLFSSKFDGSELTLLTPKFHHLKHFEYIENSNIILSTLVVDENMDKKFNENDSEILYKIELTNLSKSKIVSKLKLKEQ